MATKKVTSSKKPKKPVQRTPKIIQEEKKEMSTTQKRVKIAGNAVVLTSKLKFATIQKMEKYNNNALCLVEIKGDEEIEIFRIATGKTSAISKYGVTFMEANKDGFAVATVLLPENVADKKAYIKDNYGSVIFMLNDLEDAVVTACAKLEADFEKLDNEIEEV